MAAKAKQIERIDGKITNWRINKWLKADCWPSVKIDKCEKLGKGQKGVYAFDFIYENSIVCNYNGRCVPKSEEQAFEESQLKLGYSIKEIDDYKFEYDGDFIIYAHEGKYLRSPGR